jgi:hypothetical protein
MPRLPDFLASVGGRHVRTIVRFAGVAVGKQTGLTSIESTPQRAVSRECFALGRISPEELCGGVESHALQTFATFGRRKARQFIRRLLQALHSSPHLTDSGAMPGRQWHLLLGELVSDSDRASGIRSDRRVRFVVCRGRAIVHTWTALGEKASLQSKRDGRTFVVRC